MCPRNETVMHYIIRLKQMLEYELKWINGQIQIKNASDH